MILKDLLKQDRSYRGYDESRKITREELEDFVDCARYAPSSVNMQPFKYLLVYETEEVDRLQALTSWARGLPELNLPREGHRPTAFIVICQDTSLFESIPRFQKDVGIVAHTLLLAATEKGLGGCMIGNYDAGKVKKEMNLPEQFMPVLVVAFGKPDETIVLKDLEPGAPTAYYRDENDVHYVPKRTLEEVIIKK